MTKYGIKIIKEGESPTTTDPRKISMSSEYTMLKYHDVVDATLTISPGSDTGTVTIPHSLGYVPAYMAYAFGTNPFIQTFEDAGSIIPVYGDMKSGEPDFEAYATDTGITVTATLPEVWNKFEYTTAGIWGYQYNDGDGNEYYVAGKHDSFATGMFFLFSDIEIDQGEQLVEAYFEFGDVHCTAGSDIKFKTWGLDQDDTQAPRDYDDANSKPKTSAVRTKTQAAITSNFTYGDNVTTLVQEVIDRGGWSSGNGIGLINNDNGSDDGHAMKTYEWDYVPGNVRLFITRPGSLSLSIRVIIFKDKIAD